MESKFGNLAFGNAAAAADAPSGVKSIGRIFELSMANLVDASPTEEKYAELISISPAHKRAEIEKLRDDNIASAARYSQPQAAAVGATMKKML